MSAIRRVLSFQARHNDSEPEDEWFGRRLWVLPGERVAAGLDGVLAVEDVYVEQPMGYHIRNSGRNLPDAVWKDHHQRKKIFDYCPELSLVMDMKLERERCKGDDKQGVIHPTEEEKAQEELKKQEEIARHKSEAASRLAASLAMATDSPSITSIEVATATLTPGP